MTKYLKGKDGKFAGSIGDGKNTAPTPAPAAPHITPDADISPGESKSLDDMFSNYQAYRYRHHEQTIATMDRILTERFPGLTEWAVSAEQDDRDFTPDVHLQHIKVNGEKIYDRFSGEHGEFAIEDGELDDELADKLRDVEQYAQRLHDLPTVADISTYSQITYVTDDEAIVTYKFNNGQG